MNVKQSSEDLINEILNMLITKFLSGVNNSMQIRFHELKNHVDILISCGCIRPDNIHQLNHIVVIERLQQLDLSNDSFCID